MKEESITMSFYTFLGVCDTTGMVVLLGNGGGGGGNGGGTGGTSIPIHSDNINNFIHCINSVVLVLKVRCINLKTRLK